MDFIPENLSLEAFLDHPELFEPGLEQQKIDAILAELLESEFPLEVTPPSIIDAQIEERLPTDEECRSFKIRIKSEEFFASRETIKAVLLARIRRFVHVLRAAQTALRAKELG